jgi:hypothetical protein
MENPSRLQDALLRLHRLFPTSLSGVTPPASASWIDEGQATEALAGAIQRCGWTVLKERYEARLKSLREETPQPFESTKETIALQCRAFNEVMDEFDVARREAVTRWQRRQAAEKKSSTGASVGSTAR